MDCSHCRERLTLLISDALSPAERAEVQAHLEQCPDCARELRALQNIQQTLVSLPAAETPLNIRANVRAALRQQPRRAWALPFALPARNLAWGGALTVGALGLMLLARPVQYGGGSVPAGDIAQLEARPDANVSAVPPSAVAPDADGSKADQSFADGHAKQKSGAGAPPAAQKHGQPAPQAVPQLPAPVAPSQRDNAKALDGAATESAKAPAQTKAKSNAPAPKPSADKPKAKPPSATGEARQQAVAPVTKPATDEPQPPAPRAANADNAPQSPASPAPAADQRANAPTDAASSDAPSAPSESSREAPAAPSGPPTALAAPGANGLYRAGRDARWTGGAVTATLARRTAERANTFAGGSSNSIAGQTTRKTGETAKRNPPAAVPAPAPPAAMSDAASDAQETKPEPSAPESQTPVTLTLSAEKALGPARLMLVAPPAKDAEIWRGTLGTQPLEIPLPNAVLQRLNPQSGQKIRARLEQIDGQGESVQSLPLELTWP